MKLFRSICIAATLLTAVPATAQQIAVDPNFNYGQFDWSGNGTTTIVWRAVLIEGNIAICGTYSSRGGAKYSNLSRQAIRDMRIEGPNGVFLRGLGFFSRSSARDFQPGANSATANCRVTSTAGTPADLQQLRLGYTRQNYRY